MLAALTIKVALVSVSREARADCRYSARAHSFSRLSARVQVERNSQAPKSKN
jgi:hypothetical protein